MFLSQYFEKFSALLFGLPADNWRLQVVTVVFDCLDVVFCCLIDFSYGCYWVIGPRVEAWSLVCPSSCSDPLGALPWRQHLVWMGAGALCAQKLRIFISPGTCFLSSCKHNVIGSYQNHAGKVCYGTVLCKMGSPNPRNNVSATWYFRGTAVAQWLRCYATNRKVAGSIPAGVIGIFYWNILRIALWPWGRLSL